jgi:hypothetical protein
MTDEELLAEGPKEFSKFLLEHRKGRCHRELSYRLQELVFGVMEYDKGGSINLKIEIRPTKEDVADHLLIVTDTITINMPKPDDVSQFFFADSEGNLSLSNPDQMTIPGLREVSES